MRCLKVGFRRHVVIWFCMAVAANIAPAMAQRFDGIILQPAPVQDSKALYEIELWQMTVRMEEVENSSVNGIEQLLTLVRPKNIEIQGCGDYCVLPFPIQFPGVEQKEEISKTQLQQSVTQLTGTPTIVATFDNDQMSELLASEGTKMKRITQLSLIAEANQSCAIMDGTIQSVATTCMLRQPNGSEICCAPEIKGICNGSMAELSIDSTAESLRFNLKMDCNIVKRIDQIKVPVSKATDKLENASETTLNVPIVDARSFHISCALTPGDCFIFIPSWESVTIRPKQLSDGPQTLSAYVSLLLRPDAIKQYPARVAFVARVSQKTAK